MTYSLKRCRYCSQPFAPRSGRQEFCSDRCRYGQPKCETCGRDFVPARNSAGRFCSLECVPLAAHQGRKKHGSGDCANCGRQFRKRRAESRFCSVQCALDSRRIERSPCANCGADLRPSSNPKTRFCSYNCWWEHRSTGKWTPANTLPVGSRRVESNGYAVVKTDDGWVLEHRLVMERLLGRSLLPTETVHHRNGIRSDNRTDGPLVDGRSGNLELWSSAHPPGQSVADKVAWASDILRLYEPSRLK